MAKINWQKYKWFQCRILGSIPWNHKRCEECSLRTSKDFCSNDDGPLFYLPADEMQRCGQNLRYMKYQKFIVIK